MAFCNYEFYKNEYLGNLIAEEDFPRLAMRATQKLNLITYGRLYVTEDGIKFCEGIIDVLLDDETQDKIKKCMCALAELLSDVDMANNAMRQAGAVGVKSVSSGSESISFSDVAVNSSKNLNSEIYQIGKEYLTSTGLLYAGW